MKLAGALVLATLLTSGQTFRSAAEGVHVDALVLDGSRPIAGLSASDFEVRDSGVVQRIETVAFEDVPLNVVFALDASESVQGEPMEHLKQAALAAIELMRPADYAAVLTFDDYVALRADWTTDRTALSNAITAANSGGATALYDAAYAALTLRPPQPGRTLALVFSDGEDTASWLAGAATIDIARRNDAVVYAVELGQRRPWSPGYRLDLHSGVQSGPAAARLDLMDRFLPSLAQDTGGQVLNATRSEELRERFVRILTEFRTRYLITYSPTGVDRAGWHPIEVKLKSKKGKVTARRGYLR